MILSVTQELTKPAVVRELNAYWEQVRDKYSDFESGLKSPASEVYLHEILRRSIY